LNTSAERPPPQLESHAVRRAFARAATFFDEAAVLHREVGQRLLDRLQYMQLAPAVVIDLGAGTGYCARLLEARYPSARILALDLSPGMLQLARAQRRRWFSRSRFVATDAARLAIQDAATDLVFSNLMLPWCEDLRTVFAECQRVLRPGGLLLFSTLGPSTLQELRAAWSTVDEHPHVHVFPDMHDIGDTLIGAGFAAPVMDRENLRLTYGKLDGLLQDLKRTGAQNCHLERARGLFGRGTFRALRDAYEPYRQADVLPATFELVYGHAWKGTVGSRPQDGSTVATFPLKNLSRRQP